MSRQYVILFLTLWLWAGMVSAQLRSGNITVPIDGQESVNVTYTLTIQQPISLLAESQAKHLMLEVPEDQTAAQNMVLNLECASCEMFVTLTYGGGAKTSVLKRRGRFGDLKVLAGQTDNWKLSFAASEGGSLLSTFDLKVTVRHPVVVESPPIVENSSSDNKPKAPKAPTTTKPKTNTTPATQPKTDVPPQTTELASTETRTNESDSPSASEDSESLTSISIPPSTENTVTPPTEIPQLPWVLGGALALGLLLWFLLGRKKPATQAVTSSAVVASPPKETVPPSSQNMKFKSKVPAAVPAPKEYPAFETLAQTNDYVQIDMEALWSKTMVREVFVHQSCMLALDAFINEHNVYPFRELQGGEVPEIGGFLLGRQQETDGQYQVSLEQFVPIESNDQGVYKIEFGTQAWLALDHVKDQYPDLHTIGWFHTHPGHGLFLSKPDLKIQEGFFRKPYQLAVEIDTLTESRGLDLAIFSWQEVGTINNSTLRKADRWLSWHSLMAGVPSTSQEEAR